MFSTKGPRRLPTGPPFASTSDPHITPLAWHGGPTRTHALLLASPALDAGFSDAAITTDQRGPGFLREVPAGKPDIGAYERQINDDEIFYDGSEWYGP